MKYDVFISYSRKDTETVNRISNALEKAEISYFVDRKGIGGGMEFPEVLSQAIIDSKLFLFVASRNSYESNFTTNEITFAFNKKRRNQILPYIIDDSVLPSRLEFVFAGINWRTMSEHPIESVLIPDIMNLLGRNSQENITECNLIEKKNDILPASGVTSSTKRFERKTQSARKELEPYKDMFGLYGFRDKKTYEKIIKPIWGSVGEFYEGFAFVQDKKSGKYGYINMSGELVLPYEYIKACNFSEGLASVQTESYKGVIDKKGKVVFTHNFCVQFISFHEGLALAVEEVKSEKDLKYGFIDKNGHVVITCKWGNAKDFSNGLAPVADSNGKWGYIDKSGSLIIPCQYLQADTFLKGTARVMLSPIRLFETKTNRLPHYGYINENGNFLGYEFNEKSDLLIKIAENGQYGISRKNGEEVEPCRWKHISVFENGIAIVKNANGLSGGLDISGNLIIPCQWASVKYIRGKIYGVKSPGGGWGLFNLDNPIIPSSLWEEYIPLDGGIIGVKGDNKRWGLVTDEGKKITHCLWSSIRSSKRWSSYVMVQDTNNLWGYIDITGKVISKCLWKDVRNFSDEDMAPVQGDNGKWGFIDKEGNNLIACKWNQAYLFWNGLACVQDSSGKFGFINKKGELVISCRWMQVSGYFSKKYKYGDYVVAVFGKRFFFGEPKWYIINKRGHIIDTIDTSPKEVDFMGKKYKMEIFKPESPDFGC